LTRELDKLENVGVRGIVAISLSRIFTQNDLMCIASEAEGQRIITDALHSAVVEHKKEWRLRNFRALDARIVAVMFHLSVPWDINGERLIHSSRINFRQAGTDSVGWKLSYLRQK
jgi:hypothetical protein